MDKHFVDTYTIVVGPATGTVFPISSLGLEINALYDMGATKSCMSLKTFESLKLRLTKDRCPFVITATGMSMEPIGSLNAPLILMVAPSHKSSLFAITKHNLSF